MKTIKRLYPSTIAAINRRISRGETEFKINEYSYIVCGEIIRRTTRQGDAELVLLNRRATLPEGTLFTDGESTASVFVYFETDDVPTDITKTVLSDLDHTITDSDGAVEVESLDLLISDIEKWHMNESADNVLLIEYTDPYRQRNNPYSRSGWAFDDE